MPFVVALLLVLMLFSVIGGNGNGRANYPFLMLIGLSAIQSTVVGLRWGYGIEELRYALPLFASVLPPLAYASFRSLIHGWRVKSLVNIASIAAPPVIVAALLVVYPSGIDVFLIALFVGYAVAIVMLGRRGPDGLEEAQFASVTSVHRALFIAAFALCLSAAFDVLVLLDFEWAQGRNTGVIISNGNLFGLLLIGLTSWVAGDSRPEKQVETPEVSTDVVAATPEDHEIMGRLELLMGKQKVYRDDNLTLSRLARKMGLPSRQISQAINRATGANVSQYINQLRVRHACRLLEETDQSVTSIMLESGFQTKSNFNREFRRVTGMSPVAWRERELWTLVSGNENGHPA